MQPRLTFVSGGPAAKQVIVDFDPTAVSTGKIEGMMEEEGYPVKN